MWLWNDVTAASGPCEGHQGDVDRLFIEMVWWENKSGINWKGEKKEWGNKVTKDLRKDFFPVRRVKQWNRAQGSCAASIPVFKTQLDKALNNPGCTFAWPGFLHEVGLETSYVQIRQKTTKLFLSHFKSMTKNNQLLWKMRDWQISLP